MINPLETKVETRGRPKLPETIIKDLNAKVLELQKIIATTNEPLEEMKQLAEIIRIIQRAVKGLDPDDDVFLGLIDPKNITERTRLEETALLSHSAMRIAKKYYPEFYMFGDIADIEDHYYISEDGEGRKEAILTVQAKTKMDGNMILNMPNTNGGIAETEQPQATQPKKKNIFQRILHR
jgi:hypothetical protein